MKRPANCMSIIQRLILMTRRVHLSAVWVARLPHDVIKQGWKIKLAMGAQDLGEGIGR